jgi:hypothetical protein
MGVLALVLTVSLTAAADVPQTAPAGGATSGESTGFVCGAVRVSGPGLSRSAPLVFSSRTTPELQLRPRLLLELRGRHLLRLRVFTPQGPLYEEIQVPLDAPALDAGAERPGTARGAGARLAIAGTSITQRSLFGSWSVQPFLDDRPTPCGPVTRFTITE